MEEVKVRKKLTIVITKTLIFVRIDYGYSGFNMNEQIKLLMKIHFHTVVIIIINKDKFKNTNP